MDIYISAAAVAARTAYYLIFMYYIKNIQAEVLSSIISCHALAQQIEYGTCTSFVYPRCLLPPS